MTPLRIPKRPAPKNPSVPGSSDWVYNEIMRFIEPDLISTSIPTLARKYPSESASQRQGRYDKYKKAYALFDRFFSAVQKNAGRIDEKSIASALPQ